MQILPASLTVVRTDVASSLLSSSHFGCLRNADDIVAALNITTRVHDRDGTAARVDVTLFLRVFVYSTDEYCLLYLFGFVRSANFKEQNELRNKLK